MPGEVSGRVPSLARFARGPDKGAPARLTPLDIELATLDPRREAVPMLMEFEAVRVPVLVAVLAPLAAHLL